LNEGIFVLSEVRDDEAEYLDRELRRSVLVITLGGGMGNA
jgi:hypothetical protein